MAPMRNPDSIERLRKAGGIQTSEGIPQEIRNDIQPVIICNPKHDNHTAKKGVFSDSTGGTIYTTDAVKTTYLFGLNVSVNKDALNAGIWTIVGAVMHGTGTVIDMFRINYEPLTAGQITSNIMFPQPIRLAKNSAIQLLNNSGVASIDSSLIAYIYEVEENS